MLLCLVSSNQITKARALDIAVRINADNPEITDKILADFEEKLSKIHTE
jgi:uncharacterized protein YlaN (UPF0358 family)